MNQEAFKSFIARAEVATARRFTIDQSVALYQALHKIPDDKWEIIADRYLQCDNPPKNIEVFARYELTKLADEKTKKDDQWQLHEVNAEQHALFFDCVSLAMDAYKSEYKQWVIGFNKIWDMFTGEKLTDVLRKTKSELIAIRNNEPY